MLQFRSNRGTSLTDAELRIIACLRSAWLSDNVPATGAGAPQFGANAKTRSLSCETRFHDEGSSGDARPLGKVPSVGRCSVRNSKVEQLLNDFRIADR
jgi:hypothetical protein